MYANSIEPLNVSTTLDEVSVPVLDLYSDADTNAAITASARLTAYNSGAGLDYTQTVIICLSGLNCHQLQGLKGDDSMLLEVNVNAWMQTVAPAALVSGCKQTVSTPSGGRGGGSINV